ncbi:hypothetical protein E2F43_07095 [Seongchinamella unica]|uniref:Uncharacterized protein n=1 Tax=Seongchinamella unica TaxID=2547392 RepID=A0A4R5LWX1_9GAMM|nr:hypothetical protein [Seongchinamella unica]TDG15983.1 hypothetical protein E2F43_07095 [Seongchinamella unica]
MDITVETFLKEKNQNTSEPVGPTRLTLDESAYRDLVKLEQRLLSTEMPELLVDAEAVDVAAPSELGPLDNQQMRLFTDPAEDAAHFHLVARRSSDGALVYTEPTMIRLVAV